MVFGIDDFLTAAIAASTSYIAWSKVDHLFERVAQNCKPHLRRRFERVSDTPSILLKGFDVSTTANVPHRGRFNHKRSAAFLLGCSQPDMESHLMLFGKAELQHCFEVVAKNSLHDNGIRLLHACDACAVEIRPSYVEAVLYACVAHNAFLEASDIYKTYGAAMPIAESLLTALVGGVSSYPEVAKSILEFCGVGRHTPGPELLSAGISATAHSDWEYAQTLYRTLRMRWPTFSVQETLASLTSAALCSDERLDWLFEEVKQNASRAEPDVLLRMLETPQGNARFVERRKEQPTWNTAISLYIASPSSSNALICAQILTGCHYNPSQIVPIIESAQLSDVQWGALGGIIGASDDGIVAAALAQQMIVKSNVSPALILKPVAKQGLWPLALRLLTLSLTHRRVLPTSSEVGLAVHASISLKKWASAYFWIERSHAALTSLPPKTYDCAFEAARHMPWESTKRVVTSMRDVNDNCTEEGILTLLSAAAETRRTPDMLRLLSNSNAVLWVQ